MDTNISATMAHDLLEYVSSNIHLLRLTSEESDEMADLSCNILLNIVYRSFQTKEQRKKVMEGMARALVTQIESLEEKKKVTTVAAKKITKPKAKE